MARFAAARSIRSQNSRYSEVRGALGGAVQASRCGNVDTESHAASVSSLTLQPPELRSSVSQ